jgi:hypothetical protein
LQARRCGGSLEVTPKERQRESVPGANRLVPSQIVKMFFDAARIHDSVVRGELTLDMKNG